MNEAPENELGRWYPSAVLPDLPEQLPVPLPEDAWVRLLADPAADLPSVRVELAWVTGPVLHLVTVAGFTLAASEDDPDDEVTVQSHERVSLRTVQRLQLDTETGSATVEFTDRPDLPDAPGVLLNQHLHSA